MTTNQLTKLKGAGFTLEQIIAIGEIFDPEKPKPVSERPNTLTKGQLELIEVQRKAYEKGRKEAEDRQRDKEMGPLIRGDGWRYDPGPACQGNRSFQKRCDDFIQAQQNSLFMGSMELPPSRWISQVLELKPSKK